MALEARLREIHPYELPELMVVQVNSGSTWLFELGS